MSISAFTFYYHSLKKLPIIELLPYMNKPVFTPVASADHHVIPYYKITSDVILCHNHLLSN